MPTRFQSVRRFTGPTAGGLLAMIGLAGLYLSLVTVAESWAHARDLFRQDARFVVPILLGFGLQVGLLLTLRQERARVGQGRDATAGQVTGASGGASALTMLACCAHHLTDVLPMLGLSSAALFLGTYKNWFLAAGLVSNLAGVAFLARLLYLRHRQVTSVASVQEACH